MPKLRFIAIGISLTFATVSSLLTFDPPYVRRVCAGDTVILKCKQTGTHPLHADWQLDNTKVSRDLPHYRFESHHMFTIVNITAADSGKYDYEIIDTNSGLPKESTSLYGLSVRLIVVNCFDNSPSTVVIEGLYDISTEPREVAFRANLSNDSMSTIYVSCLWPSLHFIVVSVLSSAVTVITVFMLLMRCCAYNFYRLFRRIAGAQVLSELSRDRMNTTEETIQFNNNDNGVYTQAAERHDKQIIPRSSETCDEDWKLAVLSQVISGNLVSMLSGTVSFASSRPYGIMTAHATKEGLICTTLDGIVIGRCCTAINDTLSFHGQPITIDLALLELDKCFKLDNSVMIGGRRRKLVISKRKAVRGTEVFILDRGGKLCNGILGEVDIDFGPLHGVMAITDRTGTMRILEGRNSGALVMSLPDAKCDFAIVHGVIIYYLETSGICGMDIAMPIWDAIKASVHTPSLCQMLLGETGEAARTSLLKNISYAGNETAQNSYDAQLCGIGLIPHPSSADDSLDDEEGDHLLPDHGRDQLEKRVNDSQKGVELQIMDNCRRNEEQLSVRQTSKRNCVVRVRVSGERTLSVVVPQNCKMEMLLEELRKNCRIYLKTMRLTFEDKELSLHSTGRLADYGIYNNVTLTLLVRVGGG